MERVRLYPIRAPGTCCAETHTHIRTKRVYGGPHTPARARRHDKGAWANIPRPRALDDRRATLIALVARWQLRRRRPTGRDVRRRETKALTKHGALVADGNGVQVNSIGAK